MTQSGGQAAGIQLQVGLDLAFFRSQLVGLQAVTTGTKLSFGVTFKRLDIQNELNALATNIKKRNYFLEVKTNLANEIELAKQLATALDKLGRSQQAAKTGVGQRLGVGAIGRAPLQGGLGSKDVEKLYRASARAGLLVFDKEIARTKVSMVAAMDAIGVDAIAGLLNGLSSQDARLRAAAESIGENLIKTTKTSLGIASPSKKFEEIGKNVGKGFEKGALSSMDNAFDAMENKMRQRGRILDTIARGIFGMLGMDPAAMMQQARALPPLNFGATVPRAPAGIGPSSSGRMLPAAPSRAAIAGTPAPAGLLPSLSSAGQSKAIIEALIASTGPRLLPSGGGDDSLGKLAAPRQTKDAVDAILRDYFKVVEAQVKEVFSAPPIKKESLNIFDHLDTEQYFNYLAQARINAENAIRQSIEEAKQVTKQNRIKDAAQSFLRALETTVRNAERSIFLQSRIAANQSYVQKANIREIGQPLLGGRPVAAPKMLSAATGFYRGAAVPPPPPETQAQLFARREREARMRSAQRETQTLSERGGVLPGTTFMGDDFTRGGGRDRVTGSGQPRERGGALAFLGGGMGPSSQLGAGYFAVGKGLQAIKQAYAGVKPFLDTKKLPLSGAMAELGGEFGTAIKQVLLYGTAYKALAFFTSLPGQAFEAAKGLATYRNQLQAVTSESKTFDQSLAFVDNLAQRFNVPLDSARQGFVKLYASMQPAGFDQGQIENLFTGISKAAAAFGLSSDKVDRVNYAFAQMASKGQIMSEELKGQLGDVLPGALGLFAQAAQMSIPEFSKAMEDGAFKGKAMEQVLDNVAILMNNKFGPAAQGAAKTLQGAVNQIQNNLALMYESFGPIVDRFAAIFGPQINSLIKDVTETMKVLTGTFTATGEGFATLSPRAQAFYAAIQSLTPPLQQAGAAIADLGSRFATLLPAIVQAIAAAISFASSPLGRAAIIASVAIGTLTAAIKLLEVTGLKAAIKSVYLFIGGLLKIPAATGVARVAIIGLKLALTGVFAGAILLGLDFLIGKLFNIGDAANDSAKDIKGMRKELDAMAGAGDIEGTSKAFLDANTKLAAARKANQKALADLREAKARPEGDTQADINKGVAVANAQTKVDQTYSKVIEAQREVQATRQSRASAVALKDRQDKETQDALTKIDLSGGDGTGATGSGAKPAKERESQIPQLMLRLEKTRELAALELQITNATLTGNTAQISSLELAKQLIEFKYEAKELDLQDLTTAEKAIAKREIALRVEQAILASQLQLQIDLRKERDSIQQGFSKILEGYEEESSYQQMYLKLIDQGIRPALAKARVEVEKSFKEQDKQLDASIALNKENIAATEITIEQFKLQKNLSEESKKQLADAERRLEILKEELGLREGIKAGVPDAKGKAVEEAEKGLMPKTPGEYIGEGLEAAEDRLKELTNTGYQVVQAANAIGDAFGTAFKGLVTGSMTAQEALAGMFQSIADHFADMVAQMIAEWIKMMVLKGIEAIINPMAGLGNLGGGISGGLSSGFSAGAASAIPTDAAGWGASFGTSLQFANGGIAPGGFTAFANGGMVTGPTMGLVGEGRYNEAIVPLPDGKSIPVELAGGGSAAPTVIVNVDAKGSQVEGNEQNANQLGRVISAAVQTELIKQQRPGGLLAR